MGTIEQKCIFLWFCFVLFLFKALSSVDWEADLQLNPASKQEVPGQDQPSMQRQELQEKLFQAYWKKTWWEAAL